MKMCWVFSEQAAETCIKKQRKSYLYDSCDCRAVAQRSTKQHVQIKGGANFLITRNLT